MVLSREDPKNPGEYLDYAPGSYQICIGALKKDQSWIIPRRTG